MNENAIVHNEHVPYDPNILLYSRWPGTTNKMFPFICTNWIEESISWKKSCYISTYLSGFSVTRVKGPDAEKMMSETFINNFTLERFPVGKGKHIVACSSTTGNITGHGVCLRTAEDEFVLQGSALYPFVPVKVKLGKYDIKQLEPEFPDGFVFQLAGPKSLEIVENVLKEDIHELAFKSFRPAVILGHSVRIVRIGMGGSLSYEIQGHKEDGHEIYKEILRIGKAYDLKRLGHLTYMCNHTENGFPQNYTHFIPAYAEDPELADFCKGDRGEFNDDTILRGSMSDQGITAYYANPIEVGWKRTICWSKEFQGREALKQLVESNMTRSLCTLEWNPEDILNIFRAYYDKTPGLPDQMVYPQNFLFEGGALFSDKVMNDAGEMIGRSSGIVYTPYYKATISQGYILPKYNNPGMEVTILWGTAGTRQIPIRAKVTRTPYLDLDNNKEFDVNSIPRYKKQ